jgi:hypothetical protein
MGCGGARPGAGRKKRALAAAKPAKADFAGATIYTTVSATGAV